MMGPKKLSIIRQELEQALAATGEDPIAWLETRIAKSKGRNTTVAERTDVLEALRLFLAKPKKRNPRKKRAGSKK